MTPRSGEFPTTSFLLMVFQTWLGTVFIIGSPCPAGESKSKPEAVLITTTLCPHSTVRACLAHRAAWSSCGQHFGIRDALCSGRWASPPCWISQPIALNKVWAYLFINFYIRQWWYNCCIHCFFKSFLFWNYCRVRRRCKHVEPWCTHSAFLSKWHL